MIFGGAGTLHGYFGGGGFAKYLYGDEGDDTIWSSRQLEYEYIWGGPGADTIRGSYENTNSVINGNEGDDIIYPSSDTLVSERVYGGKGDDIINPVSLLDEFGYGQDFADRRYHS